MQPQEERKKVLDQMKEKINKAIKTQADKGNRPLH